MMMLSSESGKGEEEEEGMKLRSAKMMMVSEKNIFVTFFQALAASMIECCAV